MKTLEHYFDALQRIVENRPRRVAKNAAINNDNVSIEAGRGRGSIKKSRPSFAILIRAIESAAEAKNLEPTQAATKTPTGGEDVQSLRARLDASLGRELSLLLELYDTKKRLSQLTGGNVLPLRKPK